MIQAKPLAEVGHMEEVVYHELSTPPRGRGQDEPTGEGEWMGEHCHLRSVTENTGDGKTFWGKRRFS